MHKHKGRILAFGFRDRLTRCFVASLASVRCVYAARKYCYRTVPSLLERIALTSRTKLRRSLKPA